MIKIKYVRKTNRNTEFYNVGTKWCINITKKIYYQITWCKWFFNNRFVIYKLDKI